MMKKNVLLLLMASLFFMAGAQAQESCAKEICCEKTMNFYARVLGGANFLQSSTTNGNKATYQTGYTVDGSLGYCWRTYGLRLEAEYAFRRNGIDQIKFITEGSSKHGYFQTSSCMLNLLWDLLLRSWGCNFRNIQPFIGAGLGYDFQQMHASNSRIIFNQSWNRFSWQAMAGLACPIFRNAEITLEYKFHQGGSQFYNHSVGVGFVYKFGYL